MGLGMCRTHAQQLQIALPYWDVPTLWPGSAVTASWERPAAYRSMSVPSATIVPSPPNAVLREA